MRGTPVLEVDHGLFLNVGFALASSVCTITDRVPTVLAW